jgi:hypothetical protein
MQQVKALPAPETKQEKEARLQMQHSAASIPAPVDTDAEDQGDHMLPSRADVIVVPDLVHEPADDHPDVRLLFMCF